MNQGSCACSKTELDLFDLPPTQVAMQNGSYMVIHPREISDQHSIKFDHTAENGLYLDLAQSYFTMQVQIIGASNNKQKVGPINLWGHTLFEQVNLQINGDSVTSTSKSYPYEAMLTTELSYGSDAKKGHLTLAGYMKDTAGSMDVTSVLVDGANKGLVERAKDVKTGEKITLLMRPYLAMFQQERLLPSGTKIGMTFVPSSSAFNLMSAEAGYSTKITHMTFHVRQVALLPSLALDIAKKRESHNIKYPIRRLKTIPKTVSATSQTFEEDIFDGQIPRKMYVFTVSEKARSGSLTRNPFNLKHYNLTEIQLKVNSQYIPEYPLKPDFTKKNVTSSYFTLFSNMGNFFDDAGIDISLEDYQDGFTVYVFDLTPDMDGDHLELMKRGTVRLRMEFKEAVGESVTILAIGEFDNVLQITGKNQVIKDFE